MANLSEIREQSANAAEAVCEAAHLRAGDLFVGALIVEREACEFFDLEEVNVIPQPKAGGSFGTTAYRRFADPVAVESLRQKASAGMDVGCTLIGMHIKPVVVPLRIPVRRIGEAVLVCARRRPKFVGGERAIYREDLL